MMYDDYLGDGVYASYDGYHIVLDLRGQDNYTRIALDPPTFEALIAYRKGVMREIALSIATESEAEPYTNLAPEDERAG